MSEWLKRFESKRNTTNGPRFIPHVTVNTGHSVDIPSGFLGRDAAHVLVSIIKSGFGPLGSTGLYLVVVKHEGYATWDMRTSYGAFTGTSSSPLKDASTPFVPLATATFCYDEGLSEGAWNWEIGTCLKAMALYANIGIPAAGSNIHRTGKPNCVPWCRFSTGR